MAAFREYIREEFPKIDDDLYEYVEGMYLKVIIYFSRISVTCMVNLIDLVAFVLATSIF